MKQTAVYRLIQGQQEIIGNFQLSVEQQEKLSQLYNYCFELQESQIIDAYNAQKIGVFAMTKTGIKDTANKTGEQYFEDKFNK